MGESAKILNPSKRVFMPDASADCPMAHMASKEEIIKLLKDGACIVTDTKMALSGINKKALSRYGNTIYNFIDDEDIKTSAIQNNTTRSSACIDKAALIKKPVIFVIGNAPTALIRIYELYNENIFKPGLVIGVPVGFVNVVQAKELIINTGMPCIVARGRKGGSNIAAAICNALLYML